MEPTIWGPHAWIFLHSITLGYPEYPTDRDKQNFKNFFENLGYILPCDKCRFNYVEHMKKYNLDNALGSRDELIKWLVNIHNEVNNLNNKSSMSYENMIKNYHNLYFGRNWGLLWYFIIVLVVVLIVFVNRR